MTQVGAGKYTYELIQDFPKLPAGELFGLVSRVATDSQGRLYVFQRKDPPVVVFDRDGKYLNSWGSGAVTDPHGMKIVDDIVYTTDRTDCVAMTFTLEGKLLQVIGKRGVHSDTGCGKSPYIVLRAAGPFNQPTDMVPGPSGDLYVTDGYCNSRVHRFTRDGQLINSWGQPGKTAPGQFHLPHSVVVAPDGKVYVCDRSNRRVQIFSADGEFISMWTGMGGPNDIARDKDGVFYICEQEADGAPAFVSIRDGAGTVLARWEIRHAHGVGVDSRGDIYLGLTTNRNVDKYVRRG
jgi:DNA-binding beta-propeller fold protein YncE